jgi:hypothetical protein
MKYIYILGIALLLFGCTTKIERSDVTTSIELTTTEAFVASTTSTTTTTTTTTTFVIPEKGELCAEMYSDELRNLCGTNDVNFYIVAPEVVKCHLGAKKDIEDVLYIEVTNYNKPPYAGLQPKKMPIWSLKSNIGYNETGEISARIISDNRNEVYFVRNNHLVIVKTWTSNKPVTCTSEQTLQIAKIVDKNIILNFGQNE